MSIVSVTRGGISISRSLAIVTMMTISTVAITMSITMSVTMAITMSIVSVTRGGISISRSLAIVTMMTISTVAITMSITMPVTMSVVSVTRLSNSHSKEGTGKSSQKFHVAHSSFSTDLTL